MINQIAAGEVVEKPGHLVKELLENSIDAKATRIDLEFSDGGRRILVRDDGVGIDFKDLQKALARHATSKIENVDDLWSLNSFGFRGEALASIGAVSKLTLLSKPAAQESAGRIKSEFGVEQDAVETSGANGTTILIEDLFGNVPARLKFLRSEQAEHSYIRTVVKSFLLKHPEVTFQVKSNGQSSGFYPATSSWKERAEQVLDIKPLYQLSEVRDGYQVDALFGSPTQTEKSSKQISIFVQDRWVQDRSVQAAVMEAYRSMLMHGEFPVAVVSLKCPPSEIDVNIHPAKSQVKFRDPQRIFRLVQGAFRKALESAPWYVAPVAKSVVVPEITESFVQPEFVTTQFKQKTWSTIPEFTPMTAPATPNEPTTPKTETPAVAMGFWKSLQVVGQLNLTYILAQSDKIFYLIDQHAAQERVNFEKWMAAFRDGKFEVQSHMIPLMAELGEDEIEALMNMQKDLLRLGIEIEQSSPTAVAIVASPVAVNEVSLIEGLHKMATESVERGGSYALETTIADICATWACHSSIRAGQALSEPEMRELLNDMDKISFSGYCPHGRPVHIEFPFSQLERQFGRIV